MLKGIGVLALALFIDVAFLAAVTGPAAPERVTHVEVGELEFAPAPDAPSAEPRPDEPGMALARQGRRPAHPAPR